MVVDDFKIFKQKKLKPKGSIIFSMRLAHSKKKKKVTKITKSMKKGH